jgi:hypothetical protein
MKHLRYDVGIGVDSNMMTGVDLNMMMGVN